jgi:uncharacterized membrane protein YbhN (UPF0104 family)
MLKLAISAGLLAGLVVFLPWTQLRDAASRLPLGVWLAALALYLAAHQLGVVKWRLLVNACLANLRLADATRAYFAGLFANIYLPSIVGGDFLRGALITTVTGRPEAAILGGITDRLIDIGTLIGLTTAGVITSRSVLPGWGAEAMTALLVVTTAAMGLFVPLALRRPLARWPKRIRRPVGRSLVALRHLSRSPYRALAAFSLSLFIQSTFVMINAWIGRAVGVDAPLSIWFLVWPLAKIAALMPISLGGIAVRDAALAGLLVPFGVPMARGVIAGLVWQTINAAGSLIGGLVWWLLGRGPEPVATPDREARVYTTAPYAP